MPVDEIDELMRRHAVQCLLALAAVVIVVVTLSRGRGTIRRGGGHGELGVPEAMDMKPHCSENNMCRNVRRASRV